MRFTIPSDLSAGYDVRERILDELSRQGFDQSVLFGVRVALEEALTNAIKHGNRFDPDKQVRIEAKVTPKQVEIIVEDEGPGFDRDEVPDCTRDENLEKCTGRGVLLIEAYMSRVEWSRGGRRVRMIKETDNAKVRQGASGK